LRRQLLLLAPPVADLGRQDVLFSTDGYLVADGSQLYYVSPDDQRFVMFRIEAGESATELILVQNFFEELKRLVPN